MTDDVVTVSAPARLHLGFLDPGGSLGRKFGGIGLALDQPTTRVSLRRSARDTITGPEAERAAQHLETMRRMLSIRAAHGLAVEEAIPAHSGLGSGTQLALAVAMALRALEGREQDPAGDAARLGRGARSGLGAAFVSHGGVAVDGGKGDSQLPPPLIARLPFPEAWRVILVLDPNVEGFHGRDELDAFAALPIFPESGAAEICRLVLLKALPGLAEADIGAFGSAIAAIQEMVGGHFAAAQGGIFTSPRVAAACAALAADGAHGIGQSSWGPTGFAFAESEREAKRLVERLRAGGTAERLDLRVVCGRNHGALIERGAAHRLNATG
ncbi:beta-ribofuranosylaminobenzene 5'-phosphate synthase family protein [Aurantimonas sp. VKM B-3413]|uniref:beta-ribofuranosylaminobenzene 5'-phosphate synthase family protein n=1 Tax=Aurantimonas sp. VKM B-3413 TaxID=2779401 RepID=UPI001E578735|nr:beta-ribofuranosylaminobenzene 5'-phosphate synthase family protein [Aurantimonas sp. VKM B-3413]MCB8838223.1 GHMP kinase [Aurantimonas sp. VKM B-3413]